MNLTLILSGLLSLAALAPSIQGADLSKYRNFQLGMPLIDIARQSGAAESDVKVISSRPERVGTATPVADIKTPDRIAQWEDAHFLVSLVRLPYDAGFGSVLSSKGSLALAEHAVVESARRDQVDAPRIEAALQAKRAADAKFADEQARQANKPGFRP